MVVQSPNDRISVSKLLAVYLGNIETIIPRPNYSIFY